MLYKLQVYSEGNEILHFSSESKQMLINLGEIYQSVEVWSGRLHTGYKILPNHEDDVSSVCTGIVLTLKIENDELILKQLDMGGAEFSPLSCVTFSYLKSRDQYYLSLPANISFNFENLPVVLNSIYPWVMMYLPLEEMQGLISELLEIEVE